MDVKTFLEGGRFSEFMHVSITYYDGRMLIPWGGGLVPRVISRYGSLEIKEVYIYDGLLRIQVEEVK